jgi:hypothetical protein
MARHESLRYERESYKNDARSYCYSRQNRTMSKISPCLQAMLEPPHLPTQAVADTSHIRRVFRIREQEATEHGLSRASWLALMTATAIGVGFAPSMTALYHYATASMDLEGSVAVAELMREVGIRGIAVVSVGTNTPALG